MTQLGLESALVGFLVLESILTLSYAVLLHPRYRQDAPAARPPFVSLIVAARNEATALRQHLPRWLAQRGLPFEVVVANHASTDETAQVLRQWQAQDARLRIVDAPATHPRLRGKKIPLHAAVGAARGEVLVFTDADCRPASSRWLARMAAPFSAQASVAFVLGMAPYERVAGSAVGFWVRVETFATALFYLSAAAWGAPQIGVGRNLAVRATHWRIDARDAALPAGDDDLLINRYARGSNTQVVLHPEAWTWSAPPPDLRSWWRQKVRHTSVADRYRPFTRYLLGGLWLSGLLWWGALPLLASLSWPAATVAWLLALLLKAAVYAGLVRRFPYPGSGWAQWLGWLAYPLVVQPLLGLLSLLKPTYTWR